MRDGHVRGLRVLVAPVRREVHSWLPDLAPLSAWCPADVGHRAAGLRGHLLMICAATPRNTAAAAREHRRILAPLLEASITPGTSFFHTPIEVVLEVG